MEKWQIVHECDDEYTNEPTEWVLKVGNGKFYWIDLLNDKTFNVIDSDAKTVLKNCKSLKAAKRWVAMNLL